MWKSNVIMSIERRNLISKKNKQYQKCWNKMTISDLPNWECMKRCGENYLVNIRESLKIKFWEKDLEALCYVKDVWWFNGNFYMKIDDVYTSEKTSLKKSIFKPEPFQREFCDLILEDDSFMHAMVVIFWDHETCKLAM